MGIGDRLKLAASHVGDSLTEFALLCEVPYRTVQNYVNGVRMPQADILAQICTRSGIDAHWLITGEGDMLRPARAVEVRDDAGVWRVGAPLTPEEADLLEVYRALDPDARRQIRATAQELRRVRDIEQELRALRGGQPPCAAD